MATRSGKTGLFAFDPARCDAMSEVLAQRWWAVGLRGILAIIFGLICLLTPGIAVGAFVIVFAAYMFVDGVFAIISGLRASQGTGPHFLPRRRRLGATANLLPKG